MQNQAKQQCQAATFYANIIMVMLVSLLGVRGSSYFG